MGNVENVSDRERRLRAQRIQALRMKSACLDFLRFERRCFGIATEVGRFNSDVLGINKGITEIEVKVSMEDFLIDFKKEKHVCYRNGHQWTPDFFYMCVPENLAADAEKEMETNESIHSRYGLLVHSWSVRTNRSGSIEKTNIVKIRKQAGRLCGRSGVPPEIIRVVFMRMGSDICRRYHEILGMEKYA